MAVDFLELVLQFLKVDPSYVQEYVQQGPLQALFYALILPIIFILVFLHIIFNFVTSSRKLNLLISAAAFLFIIFQGYYKYFILLSKFWMYVIIFLAFLWLVQGRSKGGGAAGGFSVGKGGIKGAWSGGHKTMLNVWHGKKLVGIIRKNLRLAEGMLNQQNPNYPDLSKTLDMISRQLNDLWNIANSSKAGLALLPDYNDLVKRYEKLEKRVTERGGELQA